MQEIIIADTSCLILLNKIGLLEILKDLYGEVYITNVIAEEYKLTTPSWIKIKTLNISEITPFSQKVDKGEASAIAFAKQVNDCLLILDDAQARALASRLKIIYTGTIGVLLLAKEKGYITDVRSVIHKIKLTNFYISDHLEQKMIALAGEL